MLQKTMTSKEAPFPSWVAATSQRFHQALSHYLENIRYPEPTLQAAMAYATLNSGKRIRPLLVYATGYIFDAPLENLDLAALPLELIHSYSLIHDDLPAMDNAELRRGKPSCFKAFGEDMAILAGDALQSLAFEVIADHPAPLTAEARLGMVQILSRASGPSGMVSGQALDILNTGNALLSETALTQLYQLKTGALLQASVKMGMMASEVKTQEEQAALETYARHLSLAFQIQDDILDIEGEEAETGKSRGLDQTLEKSTYPMVVGLPQAKEKVRQLFAQALQALSPFREKAEYLRELTEYVGDRKK